jgi:acetyl esterase/lipase
MKYLFHLLSISLVLSFIQTGRSQNSPVQDVFPKGTVTYSNVPYAGDTLHKHLLDIYLPAGAKKNFPLVVWIHGGAWWANDKYADIGYMTHTVKALIDSGYALASIDYRWSTQAAFPAQIQDCNAAIEFLYQQASKYRFNNDKISVIGFSAGGHLASLVALSNNNAVKDFCLPGQSIHFKISCALDFYGPSDFLMLANNSDGSSNVLTDPVSALLGANAIQRPDLARIASPVSYVDKNDPPFLIVHGAKDDVVPITQSKVLRSWLTLSGVTNKLILVPDAPHYGEMFDVDFIQKDIFTYLRLYNR